MIVAKSTDSSRWWPPALPSKPARPPIRRSLRGDASMTASLVTEGTASRSARQIAQQSEALAWASAPASSWEALSLGLSVMPQKLPAALAIMADVARNPAFAADELERARKETLDDLAVSYGEPGQVANFANAPVVYAGTPFAHAADGTPASLKRLTRDDLIHFHDRHWRPDNAILVLTGDISPDEGFALAAKASPPADWPKPANALADAAGYGPSATARRRNIVIDLPGAGQAAVSR